MPEISVVVAARNVERFIGDTIQSVRSQLHPDWQLFMVIDRSNDGTGEIAHCHAAEDHRIQVIEGEFGGVSAARNRGLEAATSPFVLFLDGDDLLLPSSLDRFVQALEGPDAPIAAVAGHAKIDEDGEPLVGEDGMSRPAFSSAFPHLLERNIIVNGGAIAMRTEAARQTGGYDPTLRMGEDWEFWVRLALLGPFKSLGQQPSMLYRQRRQSAMTLERGPLLALQTSAIDKIFANPSLQQRFSAKELAKHRRAALIDLHWTATRAALHRGEWTRFLALGIFTVLRFPDSCVKGYLWRFVRRILGRRFSVSD